MKPEQEDADEDQDAGQRDKGTLEKHEAGNPISLGGSVQLLPG
jgi:hypothetical protein